MKKTISFICVLLSIAMLASCAAPSFSSQSMENPRNTLENFVLSLQARDFDSAMSCVGNYSSFAFEDYAELGEGTSEKLMADFVLDSYLITFPENDRSNVRTGHSSTGLTVVGREAQIEFSFRSFDFALMNELLARLVTEEGSERMFRGEVYENEEDVLRLAEEVFIENFSGLEDIDQFCTTEQYTVIAVYERGEWKLQISDDFYNALVGN